MLTAAVEAGAGNLLKACTQGIAQISYISSVGSKLLLRILEGRSKTDDAGQVFGACTLAALLTAAADKAGELDAALSE